MKENSIEEDIERLKLCSTNQCNICGRYEKEECMLERNRCEQHILSDYKRVLKENEELEEINNELEAEKNEAIRRYNFETIPIKKVKDKIEKYKNMCISNVKGCKNYFKDNYNELVFRRMEQLEKELLGKFIDELNER